MCITGSNLFCTAEISDISLLQTKTSALEIGNTLDEVGKTYAKGLLWDPDGEQLMRDLRHSKYSLCSSPNDASLGEGYMLPVPQGCGKDSKIAVFRNASLVYSSHLHRDAVITSCSKLKPFRGTTEYLSGGAPIVSGQQGTIPGCLPVEEDTILVVNARSEYWTNVYHNMEEVFAMYETADVLEQPLSNFRVLFVYANTSFSSEMMRLLQIDGQLDGNANSSTATEEKRLVQLGELWSHLTARRDGRKFSRLPDTVSLKSGLCFRSRVVLPMRSCSGEILSRTWSPDPRIRHSNNLAKQYMRRILTAFDLKVTAVSKLLDAGLSIQILPRMDAGHRKMNPKNADDLVQNLRNKLNATVRVSEFSRLSYAEQIRQVHQSQLLISTHGAGLTHVMFLPEDGGLIEITAFSPPFHGPYREGASVANIYMNMASWTNHRYKAVQAQEIGDFLTFDVKQVVSAASDIM